MPRYLSPEWFAAAGAVAGGATGGDEADGQQIALEQHVHGSPDGDVHYCVRVDDAGQLTIEPGPCHHPDATFSVDYETAGALFRGEITAENALMNGRMKVTGNIAVLLEHGADLAGASATPIDQLRADTTF